MSQTLKIGDWTKQGLSFYSGAVSYRTNIKVNLKNKQKLMLRVPSYQGTAVRVWVNSKPVGVIAWQPNEVEITDYLSGSHDEIAIEVFSHRANSHGPLHLDGPKSPWMGPEQFVTQGSHWKDTYQLIPCGLISEPELIVKQ